MCNTQKPVDVNDVDVNNVSSLDTVFVYMLYYLYVIKYVENDISHYIGDEVKNGRQNVGIENLKDSDEVS